jgi:hypothetical protein
MNEEIGTVAAQFLFWEYINGIFVAVWPPPCRTLPLSTIGLHLPPPVIQYGLITAGGAWHLH